MSFTLECILLLLCNKIELIYNTICLIAKGKWEEGEKKKSIPDFPVLHTFLQLSAKEGKSIYISITERKSFLIAAAVPCKGKPLKIHILRSLETLEEIT